MAAKTRNAGRTTRPKTKAAAPGKAPAKPRSKSRPTPRGADWRVEALAQVRRMIETADPEMTEERKWVKPTNPMGVPVWSHGGMVCTGETYKEAVKLTFARGASLPDPARLFNASLEGGTRRAIDIREGETLDEQAFMELIRAAVARNLAPRGSKAEARPMASARTILLSRQPAGRKGAPG